MTLYVVDKNTLDLIHDELANHMDELQEVVTDYEGRRMWGKKCIGWIHGEGSLKFGAALLQAIVAVAKDNPDSEDPLFVAVHQENWWEVLHFISGGSEDSMGHSTITYFPDLVLKEAE